MRASPGMAPARLLAVALLAGLAHAARILSNASFEAAQHLAPDSAAKAPAAEAPGAACAEYGEACKVGKDCCKVGKFVPAEAWAKGAHGTVRRAVPDFFASVAHGFGTIGRITQWACLPQGEDGAKACGCLEEGASCQEHVQCCGFYATSHYAPTGFGCYGADTSTAEKALTGPKTCRKA